MYTIDPTGKKYYYSKLIHFYKPYSNIKYYSHVSNFYITNSVYITVVSNFMLMV